MKWKYLAFVIVPIIGAMSLLAEGVWTYSAIFFSFGFIPFFELFLKPDSSNISAEKQQQYRESRYFDWVIYSVLPIYVALLGLFIYQLTHQAHSSLEFIGKVSSFGLMTGILSINVGHELGHRHNTRERAIGESLLVLSLQAHFLPYHNHGHHRNVATLTDPATARKNEPLFVFWFRSQFGSYTAAWIIEYERLTRRGKSPLTIENRMIRYTLAETVIVAAVYFYAGPVVLGAFLLSCFLGMLLLETVNYIEHYGLSRKQDSSGKYERVNRRHSWNSDHLLGRLMLFELSRHSDHHANPGKHYQTLDSYQDSPQMPTGYPGMMLLSLIPPLWFSVMNSRIEQMKDEEPK